MNKYEVIIKKLDHGYQVKVGCKIFAKENLKEILVDVKDYFENPEKVYKKYGIEEQNIVNDNINTVEWVDFKDYFPPR